MEIEESKELMQSEKQKALPVDNEDMLIDEEADEEDTNKQSSFKPRKSAFMSRRTIQQSIGVSQLGSQANPTSAYSIDESTIRTSVEMNSSTNKSSGDEKSDHESQSSSDQSNYTHYTNASQWKILKNNNFG